MRDNLFPVELVGGVPVVTAPEEVDITNAAGLRAALVEAAEHPTFVVDMSGTRFCDSAGIHALVDAHKQAQATGGQVVLAMSGRAVPRIFALTGVDRVIPTFDGLAEALRHTPAGTGPLPLLPDLRSGLTLRTYAPDLRSGLTLGRRRGRACCGRRRSGRPSARR